MDLKPLFTEKQRFKQWWVWLILLLVNGVFLYSAFVEWKTETYFEVNPKEDTGMLIGTIVLFFVNVLFYFLKLTTVIDQEGITVRFLPFHIRNRRYNWDSIKSMEIRTYKPILEYGGWGIRGFGSNRAFNVSGNVGLQLEFNDGKKLLIGTNQPDELKAVLQQLGKVK